MLGRNFFGDTEKYNDNGRIRNILSCLGHCCSYNNGVSNEIRQKEKRQNGRKFEPPTKCKISS